MSESVHLGNYWLHVTHMTQVKKKFKPFFNSLFYYLTQKKDLTFAVTRSPSKTRKSCDFRAVFSPIVSFCVQPHLVFSAFGAINVFTRFSKNCVVRQMFRFIYRLQLQLSCIELSCIELNCKQCNAIAMKPKNICFLNF